MPSYRDERITGWTNETDSRPMAVTHSLPHSGGVVHRRQGSQRSPRQRGVPCPISKDSWSSDLRTSLVKHPRWWVKTATRGTRRGSPRILRSRCHPSVHDVVGALKLSLDCPRPLSQHRNQNESSKWQSPFFGRLFSEHAAY
ncbi:unnamed protein product [Soboliphyme baturini]|uniref:Uncharacterized protein n=1 Tax=Soboliphyme baturini TaxID=241478 RepID=A0A183IQ83_9BILA|nr:unnamed protein product [Soboliphyme baturini]